ncbi:putative MADS-domain-containing protein [Cinnamomum micranthum f. kanehirae]|uniref:Putative MADS-domain-containing protein n=1 Tax=Cinnamomum micranthum f. kanehirae TaxID=337451 RepID=A0A443NCY5_9MAGN|nr:putative MADS-domain-containing protein [Cinnamomum micranthum f. kanehirae]
MGKRKCFEQEDVKFAKRRNTLYKKAQELSILCGSDIAVVVISSSTGKVSTYGSPDPGIVIGRYQSQKKNVQDGARSGSGKVIMTKDEENTMKHLLVPYEEENLGTIPNPEPMTTEPFLLPGLMEIASFSSSWMPSSSSIQSSQPLATSYGCGGGLDGLSYFDFDASSSGLIDPKSLNQESGATYGSAPYMFYSSSSFSSSGSGFGFVSSSSDYGCGFNGFSAPDSQGCGLDPNFLNQERGAQYDGSSIPISYSSSSSSSSSVSSVLPPSSSTDCLQPMATPPTGYGFDDPLSLDVTELEPSFDVGEFLDELYQSHPISPSSNGHGFNDDDPLLFDVNDDDPLFFDVIDDDPLFFDVNEFLK